MEKHKFRLSEDAKVLDSYLKNYNRCKVRKRALEKRRQQIIFDFNYPIKNINLTWMPKAKGIVDEGSAVLPLQLDEIDTRIKEKIEDAQKEYFKLNEIIGFLDTHDIGRMILEYRYIDYLPWWKIAMFEKKSKTTLVYIWRKTLYRLLEFPKIRQIVEEFKKTS